MQAEDLAPQQQQPEPNSQFAPELQDVIHQALQDENQVVVVQESDNSSVWSESAEGEFQLNSKIAQSMEESEQVSKSVVRTKNEQINDKLFEKDFQSAEERLKYWGVSNNPDDQLILVGQVLHTFSDQLVIQHKSLEKPAFDLETPIFTEAKDFLGKVEDVFGQVDEPFYTVKLDVYIRKQMHQGSVPIQQQQRLFTTQGLAKPIEEKKLTLLKNQPGTDASNKFDEEVPQDEIEDFSDDEKELRLKHKNKRKPQNQSNMNEEPQTKRLKKSQPKSFQLKVNNGNIEKTPLDRQQMQSLQNCNNFQQNFNKGKVSIYTNQAKLPLLSEQMPFPQFQQMQMQQHANVPQDFLNHQYGNPNMIPSQFAFYNPNQAQQISQLQQQNWMLQQQIHQQNLQQQLHSQQTQPQAIQSQFPQQNLQPQHIAFPQSQQQPLHQQWNSSPNNHFNYDEFQNKKPN